MTVRTLVRAVRLFEHQERVIQRQTLTIAELQQELRRVHLDYNRDMRSIVCGWLINLEKPELDIRGDLADLDTKIANRIAELEEHVL